MGYDTMPITVEQAMKLVRDEDVKAVVISASRKEYFGNMAWLAKVVKAEICNDSETIIFRLPHGEFVEFSRAYNR